MLYSSTAALQAWVILGSSGKNPDVLDLDILPTGTITLAVILLPWMLWLSPALAKSRATPIISLWIIWVWLGTIACCVSIYVLDKDPKEDKYGFGAFNFAELACWGNAGTSTLLQSPSQLDSRQHDFTCTYECFSSRPSVIRAAGEVVIIRASDFWSEGRSHDALADNVVIGAVCGAVLFVMFLWLINKKDAIPATVFQHTLKQKVIWRLYMVITLLAPIAPVCFAIILAEIIMLRREGLLRRVGYQSVGQWSPLVCIFLVVFAAMSDIHVFAPRRTRKERAADIELAASQPPPPPYESGTEVHHEARDNNGSRTSQNTDTSWRTATETRHVVPTSRQPAISQMRELALRDGRTRRGQRRA